MEEFNAKSLDLLIKEKESNLIDNEEFIFKLLEFEKHVFEESGRFQIYYALGATYCIDGPTQDLNLAETYLLKSVNDFPTNAIANELWKIYFNLGHLYARKCQLDKSREYFEKYILYSDDKSNLNIMELPLYSFRSVNKFTISDLVNNEITLSAPKTFNDPYDILLYSFLDYRKRIILKESNYSIEPYIKAYETIRIRCFASDKNNFTGLKNRLMWSHYADEHKGICILYKFDFRYAVQTYVEQKSITIWIKEIYEDNVVFKDKKKETKQLLLATKHKEWEYENEIRLFHYDPAINKEQNHIQIPLEKLGGEIMAIVFGSRCSIKDEQTIRKLFKGNDFFFKLLKIEQLEDSDNVYEMKIDDEEKWYSLNPWLERDKCLRKT